MSELLKQIAEYRQFLNEWEAAEASGKPYHIERFDGVSGWQPITAAMANCGPGETERIVYDPPKPRTAWVRCMGPGKWGQGFATKVDDGKYYELVEMEEVLRDANGKRIPSEREQELQAECDRLRKSESVLREFVEAVQTRMVKTWRQKHGLADLFTRETGEVREELSTAAAKALELADGKEENES